MKYSVANNLESLGRILARLKIDNCFCGSSSYRYDVQYNFWMILYHGIKLINKFDLIESYYSDKLLLPGYYLND